MNRELYDIEIEFPSHMRDHMRICLSKIKNPDKTSEGYKRNEELQGQHSIKYPQLKRIKNFFDNYKGKHTSQPFILNGGIEMKNWVNNELRRMRDGIHMPKKNQSDTGMMNRFIDSHEKKDFTNVRASQQHSKTVDKYNQAVTESLKRINELISKI